MASFGKTTVRCNGQHRQHHRNCLHSSCPRRGTGGPLPPLAPNRALEDTMRRVVARTTQRPMKKAVILSVLVLAATANAQSIRLAFEGTQAIHKLLLKDLGPDFASDWSALEYLVLEIRTSTPQRFHLIVQDKTGIRRLGFQPFGQNVWFRAAVP